MMKETMNDQPVNASNKKQIKAASAKEIRGREREIEDMRAVLRTREGRRLVWRLLGRCKVFETVFDQSGSRVYYNTGQQDIGHFLLSEVMVTDQNKFLEMMIEAKDDENV